MDKYLNSFREMISLRGLTDHTLKNYCTYIRAYLDYLTHILHKAPEDVSWNELRDFIRWIQKSRGLSDRTINCAISQLRFFTMYVLHKTWDDTQLPMRRFDEYLPYVPSKEETWQFISSMPDLKHKTMVTLMYSSGLRIGEVCRLRYEDVDRKHMRLHISHSKSRNDRYAILSKAAHLHSLLPIAGSFLFLMIQSLFLPEEKSPVNPNVRSLWSIQNLSGAT